MKAKSHSVSQRKFKIIFVRILKFLHSFNSRILKFLQSKLRLIPTNYSTATANPGGSITPIQFPAGTAERGI